MEYRVYKPEDFAELYAIEEVCFQPPFRFGRRYMRSLVEARSSATWIAEDAGTMAGFAIEAWEDTTRGRVAYVQTIEVLPSFRRRGAGAELLRRLEESARLAGAEAIWLHVDQENRGAIRLYETHGYRLEGGEDDFYAPGRGALVYGKSLRSAWGR